MAPGARPAEPELTVDAFLGGKVEAVQPAKGHHRSGLEAVLLAASLAGNEKGTIVDLGAGAGVAGFCAAERCPAADVLLVEREALLVECARKALARPANRSIAGRIKVVEADIFDLVADRTATAVLINPPFNPASSSVSPKRARAGAHVLREGRLDGWLETAARLLGPKGRVIVIFRAEGLDRLLAATTKQFGALDILPIHPRATAPAHRVIVSGIKGSRAPLRLMPPLVLHADSGNAYRPEVDRLLRGGEGLADIGKAWQSGRGGPSSRA